MMRGIVFLCLIGLVISSCSSTTPQPHAVGNNIEPTPVPLLSAKNSLVAQGHLVPAASVGLSFGTSGWVGDVLVQEGDSVKTGDVIARLTNSEALDAKISSAKIDVLNAQQQLDKLQTNLPEEQMAALDDLHNAQDALVKSQAQVDRLTSTDTPVASEIDLAQANVVIAKNALFIANYEFKSYANQPEDNVLRATMLVKLSNAQDQYNLALARLNDLLQKSSNPEAELDQAKNELAVAQARVAEAQARYDLLMQGPDPKEVMLAQARVDAANKSLLAAQADLKQLELFAPMDGTVVNLNLVPGQYISNGQILLTVANFSQWYIETDTLVENQVGQIYPGQAVTVIPDAYKDITMDGVVEMVSSTYQDNQGNITYTAKIRVDKVDPRLRWGMKVVANFASPAGQ